MTPAVSVSVVIPTYNRRAMVREAIDSVLVNTGAEFELIVVDDGSTDDTRERLSAYGDRIRYVYQHNQHLSAARNTGIRHAKGALIGLLDSDDVWVPDKLERQVEQFLKFPEVGVVGTARFCIDPEGTPSKADRLPDTREVARLQLIDLLEFPAFCPSSALVRRSCFDEAGFFDESLRSVEDMEMWLRIGARYPVMMLSAPLTGLRLHPESMSTKADTMFRNHQKVLTKSFANIPELRRRRLWRLRAEARMYCEASWMRYCAGQRLAAIRDVVQSVIRWPLALRRSLSCRRRLARVKLLTCYCLPGRNS
jgi:glycosyltransferase involved in cell wall biosynthesis